VLESAIGGDEHMVFQTLPAEIEKGLDLMVRKCFDQPRINGCVYNDAHARSQ